MLKVLNIAKLKRRQCGMADRTNKIVHCMGDLVLSYNWDSWMPSFAVFTASFFLSPNENEMKEEMKRGLMWKHLLLFCSLILKLDLFFWAQSWLI